MRDTYEGKIKPGELDTGDIINTYKELNEGVGKGYGKDFVKTDGEPLTNPRIVKMKQNLYKFAAAKNATMLQDINSRLYDGNRLRNWDEFKREVDKLGIQYKVQWLEAEYRTARESGHMAQKWADIQANVELFPNLKYKTQGDDRVRPEHEKLNGIIAPINSKFWDRYYPPNGWRCRCDVVQTAEPASDTIPEKVDDVKPEFHINVGKSGQVYNEDSTSGHRFFALAKELPGWEKRFELSKLEAAFENVKTPNGGNVKVSIYSDQRDIKDNMTAAKLLTDSVDVSLQVNPHLNLPGYKNPEFTDGTGTKGDRVSPEWRDVKNATSDAFSKKLSRKKKGQLANEKSAFLVIDLSDLKPTKDNVSIFTAQSWSKFRHYGRLQYVIYYRGSQAVKLTRGSLKEGFEEYSKQVNKLFSKRK